MRLFCDSLNSKFEEYKLEEAKRKEAESKAAESNQQVISDLNRELEALRAKLAEAERCVIFCAVHRCSPCVAGSLGYLGIHQEC